MIANSVDSISIDAFSGCYKLTSINIPDSVTFISSSAFEECSSLTSVNISKNITHINKSVFKGTPWFENILATKDFVIINNILICCGNSTSNLSSITIPDGVISISSGAFLYSRDEGNDDDE